MKKKSAFRFVVTLFACMLLFYLAACSSDDAEDIAEEVLPSTMARTIHLSPDAPEVDVDYELIEVQSTVVGLNYGDASTYSEVSSGTTRVAVRQASNDEEVASFEGFLFASDVDNTVYIVNLVSDLEFILSNDDRTRDDDNAKVRFVHAAPDAPAVDVKTDAPDGPAVFSDAEFKDITEYTAVAPGDYTFVVTAAGEEGSAVATFQPVTLDAGRIYTVVALGTLDDGDDGDPNFVFGVRVYVDSGDGDSFVDLELEATE